MAAALPDHFTKMLAKRYLNLGSCRDIVEEAAVALERGFDSPSLRVLAGLPQTESLLSPWEVDSLLKRTIEEMGHVFPDRDSCIAQYVHQVARSMLARDTTPEEGCAELKSLSRTAPARLQLDDWVELDEDLRLAMDQVVGNADDVRKRIIGRAEVLVANSQMAQRSE